MSFTWIILIAVLYFSNWNKINLLKNIQIAFHLANSYRQRNKNIIKPINSDPLALN